MLDNSHLFLCPSLPFFVPRKMISIDSIKLSPHFWHPVPTGWTWVWVSSRSWWWTGKPGMLQSVGLQRVGHDWVTELNWTVYGQWIWRMGKINDCDIYSSEFFVRLLWSVSIALLKVIARLLLLPYSYSFWVPVTIFLFVTLAIGCCSVAK